ncbi:MAG: polysaccharide deacetylase family protein [Promethearchaeota archaeon]
MVNVQYIKQLLSVYRRDVFYLLKKTVLNFYLQLTPTEMLVNNMNTILEKHGSTMTYFIASYLLEDHPERAAFFKGSKHLGLPHGYRHFNLKECSEEQGLREIVKAKKIFNAAGLDSWCFRAPYAENRFGNQGKAKFYQVLHDAGYECSSSEFQESPPWKPIKRKIPEFVMGRPSDDQLIDVQGIWDVKIFAKKVIRSIRRTRGSLIIFDMHPLRMGQKRLLPALDAICEYAEKDPHSTLIDFKTAVQSYKEGQTKNFICITGDIDTWTYLDYIKRLK